jgi:hypothetical protein
MISKDNQIGVGGGKVDFRRIGIVLAGIAFGAGLTYLLSRVLSGREDNFLPLRFPDQPVDDRGTGQNQAAKILRNLRDRAFESSDERLALALGRPPEEVVAWNAGAEVIDDDVVMKARGIAMNRGVRIE